MILTVANLTLSFADKTILKNISFPLERGEIACLLGASGCGKTTILRAIAGFERPQTGTITLNQRTLSDSHCFIPPHQRNIGMVFQDYALFPHLTVAQNIAFGIRRLPKNQQKTRINELLEHIRLNGFADRYPHELSGGQQQRVALARALAPKPELILLDEPFSNLDTDLRTQLSQELRDILKQQNIHAIIVTHDQNEAFTLADKIGFIHQGCLQQWGTPHELYHHPSTSQVATALGEGTLIPANIIDSEHIAIADTIHSTTFSGSLKPQSSVQLLIRPQQIIASADSPVHAKLIQSDFRGSHYRCRLALGNGITVAADFPTLPETESDGTIGIRLLLDHPIIFPNESV